MLSSMATLQGDAEVVVHQAASGDGCKKRNAKKIFGSTWKSTCKCRRAFIASAYCAEADRGKEEFDLTKETSPLCKCQENKCKKKYRATDQLWQKGQFMCKCQKFKFPHALCGVPWGSKAPFSLEAAKEGCKCLSSQQLNKLRPTAPVKVAALNLCTAFWRKSKLQVSPNEQIQIRKEAGKGKTLTPKMCKQVVAEGLAPAGLKELKDLSKVEHQGYGRLDPLVPGTAVHHHLQHVCADECQHLVRKMTNEKVYYEIQDDIRYKGAAYEEACADRVVRQVEADVLGCCAESCGYNGKSCLAWPFFTKAEKVTWLEECCTEYNVLSGSPREKMCNSVLTPDQAKKVSATDIKPLKKGTDVGEPYIGQGPLLLWTEKGVNSELGKFYSQSHNPPKPNGPVSSQVMEEHPHIRAEALKNKWFKQRNIIQSDSDNQANSFMEARRNACDFSKTAHCTPTFQELKKASCVKHEKWQVSERVLEKKGSGDGCPKENVRRMATPEDCITAFRNEPKLKSIFFEFHNDDGKPVDEKSPATPINCYVDTTDCGEDVDKKFITDLDQGDRHSLEEFTYWFDAEDLP
eukprot:Skav213030  [mRNA]  locus=scaffold2312:372912:374639:- [translate_table: standard]